MNPEPPSSPRRMAGIGVGVTASVAAVSVVVSVVALGEPDLSERIRQADDVVSHRAEAVTSGRATVVYSREVGRAMLILEGLPPASEGESYHLWVAGNGGVRSGGTFVPEGGAATVVVEGTVEVGTELTVTLETDGEADRPSGEVLVRHTLP